MVRFMQRRSAALAMLMGVLTFLSTASTTSAVRGESPQAALSRKERILSTHMSTKTMYPAPKATEIAKEDVHANSNDNGDDDTSQCVPIQLNYVVRHGTRYPTIKDITRIAQTHDKLLRVEPSEPLAHWVRDWENPYDATRAGWLAAAGVFEQISLGKRLRDRFASGFHAPFDSTKYVFEHTYKPRTQQSAMGFAYGFFGSVQPVYYATDPIGGDHELRFFDNCPVFAKTIDRNKTATIEHTKYRTSAQMQRNLRKFQQLAGDNQQLTQNDLEAAYAACAFDVAVHATFNRWCALFDDDMLVSMDYFHDLKHFYKKSHGNALAFEIAAPLLQDLHRSMLERVQGKTTVEGHFRFAHAETILPLASLLNLSYFDRHVSDQEGHFLADTPLEIAAQRAFRGSVLAPFSGNIGFVLYQCDGNSGSQDPYKDQDKKQPTYRVQTLLHERTVRFRDCGGEALCPFGRFEELFSQWIHEYDFFGTCAL